MRAASRVGFKGDICSRNRPDIGQGDFTQPYIKLSDPRNFGEFEAFQFVETTSVKWEENSLRYGEVMSIACEYDKSDLLSKRQF